MLPPEVIVEMVRKKISEIAIYILSSHQGSEKDALGLVLQSFGIKTDMRGGLDEIGITGKTKETDSKLN